MNDFEDEDFPEGLEYKKAGIDAVISSVFSAFCNFERQIEKIVFKLCLDIEGPEAAAILTGQSRERRIRYKEIVQQSKDREREECRQREEAINIDVEE